MRSLAGMCCVLLLHGALILGLSLSHARRAGSAGLTVDSLSDTPDAVPADGLCTDAARACTLRAAIEQADANTSPQKGGPVSPYPGVRRPRVRAPT